MTWPVLLAVALLPYAVFKITTLGIRRVTGRGEVLARLKGLDEKEQKHLNERIGGYKVCEVRRVWDAIARNPSLLDRERAALRLDLIFATLYGAALAASLLFIWDSKHRESGAWLVLPPLIYLLSDWMENFVHLQQLRRYEADPGSLDPGWIQVASKATSIKLIFFLGSLILAVVLVFYPPGTPG